MNWKSGEPNNAHEDGVVGNFDPSGQWNDVEDSLPDFNAVCELFVDNSCNNTNSM